MVAPLVIAAFMAAKAWTSGVTWGRHVIPSSPKPVAGNISDLVMAVLSLFDRLFNIRNFLRKKERKMNQ